MVDGWLEGAAATETAQAALPFLRTHARTRAEMARLGIEWDGWDGQGWTVAPLLLLACSASATAIRPSVVIVQMAPRRPANVSPRLASSRAAQFAMLYVLLSGHRLVSMRMQLGRAGAGANAVRPSIETGLNKLRAFTTALTNFVTRSHASHNPRLRVHSRITSSAHAD